MKLKNIVNLLTITAILIFAPASAMALDVVATLPDLAAIAKSVGGDEVSVSALARPNEDPHRVDPTPDKVIKLNQADLLITVGLELEDAWLDPIVKESRNAKLKANQDGRLVTSQFVKLIDVPTGTISRAQGDIHAGGNPHFYSDPRAAAKIAVAIEGKLKQLDPENSEKYTKNTRRFLSQLRDVMKENISRFKTIPKDRRVVVTYHKSLDYLTDWLGLNIVGNVEVKPGIPPTPAHVAALLQKIKDQKVKLFLQEKFYSQSTSSKLAKLADGSLVTIDGGAEFTDSNPNDDYVKHLKRMTDAIYGGLK